MSKSRKIGKDDTEEVTFEPTGRTSRNMPSTLEGHGQLGRKKSPGVWKIMAKMKKRVEDEANGLGSDAVHCWPMPTKLWDVSAVIANFLG